MAPPNTGYFLFNVAIPGGGVITLVQNEDTGALDNYGGDIWLRNSGTVNLLLGGNDQNCVGPLNPADPWLGPLDLDDQDSISAKVASGATAGQITVMVRVK